MKRFVSLGAAMMMGTVLSKGHKHGDKKAIAKAEKIRDQGFLVPKKYSVQPREDADIFVETNDQQNISEGNYVSPVTSQEIPALDVQSASNNQDSSFSPEGNVRQTVKQALCVFQRKVLAWNYCSQRMAVALVCYNCEEDGCKEEWHNCFENDGTPDNSAWTSIETDGILETSPSVNQSQNNLDSSSSPRGNVGTQICLEQQQVWAQNYCNGQYEIATRCYNCEVDGCKWEWNNCYEWDGTPDNSEWTSIETDGLPETSPSLNELEVEDLAEEGLEGKDLEKEAFNELGPQSISVKDPVTCISCKYDQKKKQTTCFNGIERIPQDKCDEFN